MVYIVYDIETNGLDSFNNRVTCISIKNYGGDQVTSILGPSEREILEKFWFLVKSGDTLVSYNGDDFDLPFIIKRSLINNITISKFTKHIDLRKVVNGFWYSYNKYEKGKLCDWASVLGFKVGTDDGSKMPKYYEDGQWDVIKEHCEEDVQITYALLTRCINCGLI